MTTLRKEIKNNLRALNLTMEEDFDGVLQMCSDILNDMADKTMELYPTAHNSIRRLRDVANDVDNLQYNDKELDEEY